MHLNKVKGQWVYFYRAVDKEGQTVDFMLAARAGYNGLPEKVTIDKSGAK